MVDFTKQSVSIMVKRMVIAQGCMLLPPPFPTRNLNHAVAGVQIVASEHAWFGYVQNDVRLTHALV